MIQFIHGCVDIVLCLIYKSIQLSIAREAKLTKLSSCYSQLTSYHGYQVILTPSSETIISALHNAYEPSYVINSQRCLI